MTQLTQYQPGVCNIGPAEIRRRRMNGYLFLGVAVVYLIVAFAFGWAPAWRLIVFVPAFMSASGFLQAAFHFCAGFGTRGLFNFNDLGHEEAVHEAEYRKKDQRKALQILALSAGIGLIIALAAFFIPLA